MNNETFYTQKNINKIKIALISDIHYYENFNQKIFSKIINQIKKNIPDYITIIGDILDGTNTTDLTNLKSFLTKLTNIAPTIVVLGNHDEKEGYNKNWTYQKSSILIDTLNNINNLYLLNDSTITFDNICFYGFNLSFNYYEIQKEDYKAFCNEIKDLKANINNKTYNITLIHSPMNIYTFIKNNPKHNLCNSDLILSGHMHNGCLPYIISYPLNKIFKTSRGILSPNRKLFPKYAQGRIYEKDGYVYQGITKLSKSTKFLHNFNVLFQKKVKFITIEKK